jgi:hypothetical protein
VPDPCSGPTCTRVIDDKSPSPYFCSLICATKWAVTENPTEVARDGGTGHVNGASFAPGQQPRSRADRVLRYAFGWLDSHKPEAS